jgi:hypothetical protein
LALLAAAGLFVGGVAMPSAKAADLGGDCCADLEERVAELEATTARKGNRKVSLTITGQVNRAVLWWDDGHTSKTYYGLDNTSSSSRFSFLGEARIAPKVKSGFEIMIEIEAGGTGSKVSQLDEDGKITTAAPLGNNVSFNGPSIDGYFGDVRRAAWWLEHADVGRLTVGRYEGTGTPYTIDLGGIGAVAPGSKAIGNVGSFYLRGPAGEMYAANWGNFLDPVGTSNGTLGRRELVRYDSPSLMGFILGAHIGEDGSDWGVQLRYAGEFSGVRLAAQVGYDRSRDRATPAIPDPTNAAFTGPKPDVAAWGVAGSVLHVPSGLFLQGHWFKTTYGDPVANLYWGSVSAGATATGFQKDGKDWLVQGGITKNWTGWGNTALYGEYGKSIDFAAFTLGRDFPGASACAAPFDAGSFCTNNFSAIADVTSSEATMWGIGIVQNIDAAAMELYLGYRRFSLDINGFVGTAATNLTTTAATGTPISVDDFQLVTAGARIKF